jgi:hypothetical protein
MQIFTMLAKIGLRLVTQVKGSKRTTNALKLATCGSRGGFFPQRIFEEQARII